MTKAELLFPKYRNMIRQRAWHYAKAWNMDFEDLESQGYLVFMEALERHDASRASFSTFLYDRLKTLKDYCEYMARRINHATIVEDPDLEFGEDVEIPSNGYAVPVDTNFSTFLRTMEKAEEMVQLSSDALDILEYVLAGEWDVPGINRKPSLSSVTLQFRKEHKWSATRTETAWAEIQTWWKATESVA